MKWYLTSSVFFCLCFVASLTCNKPSGANEKTMLAVVLNSDREDYSLSNDIHLDVRVVNSSEEPLTIYGRLLWGYAGGLTLHVTADSDKEIAPKVLDDDLVIPSTLVDRNSFVVLAPNHYLGTTRIERLTDLVEKPGTYFIRVEYRSPVPLKFGQGPKFWSFEKPPISSQTIEVHITQ